MRFRFGCDLSFSLGLANPVGSPLFIIIKFWLMISSSNFFPSVVCDVRPPNSVLRVEFSQYDSWTSLSFVYPV